MAGDLEQRTKLNQVLGEGLTRRVHLAALYALALSGVAIQFAVWWYSFQFVSREWGMAGILVCAFASGVLVLTVGLLMAPLWRRLKGVLE